MRYAFFQGCNIPARIEQYARAAKAVFASFDVELVELRDFTCCGYPVRNVDERSYILPSIRNMAIAERENLEIAVICNCCFASLMKAGKVLEQNRRLQEEINELLAKEGLHYSGKTVIRHYLSILSGDIGIRAIEEKLLFKIKDIAIAVIQGCHVLRPREITGFDNSFVPEITDGLIGCTGAGNLHWPGKLECCGAPLAGINDTLSHRLLSGKIEGAQQAGADFITPICAYCHLQFDTLQGTLSTGKNDILPVLLYPQLLGLCLGIAEEELGLVVNKTVSPQHIEKIKACLVRPEEGGNRKNTKKQAV